MLKLKIGKKIVSSLLAIAMLVSMLSFTSFAEEAMGSNETTFTEFADEVAFEETPENNEVEVAEKSKNEFDPFMGFDESEIFDVVGPTRSDPGTHFTSGQWRWRTHNIFGASYYTNEFTYNYPIKSITGQEIGRMIQNYEKRTILPNRVRTWVSGPAGVGRDAGISSASSSFGNNYNAQGKPVGNAFSGWVNLSNNNSAFFQGASKLFAD